MMVLKKPGLKFLLLSFSWFLITFLQADAQENRIYQSLQHALFSSSQLIGDNGPQNLQWFNSDDRYTYTVKNLQHFAPEIRVYDIKTEEDSLLFHPAEYTFPHTSMPFYFEKYEWSDDFNGILFQTNFSKVYRYSGTSDYYYFDVNSEQMNFVVNSAFNAELSPDGGKVGYHKDGEMFVYNLETDEEIQLTHSAEEHLFNGRFGWVYEDEFTMVKAWKWSNDSRYIAYWQTDESEVERFTATDYAGTYPEYIDIPYPKAGGVNPEVHIGIVNTETGQNYRVDLDGKNGLIPRIYWTANAGELAVVWMNREQNNMHLYFYDVEQHEKKLIAEEVAEEGWIDIYSYFSGADDFLYFPPNRDDFFWLSDKNGFNHIYRYDYNGNVVNQITEGDWEVTQILSINSETETIYYESTEANPLERHLYSTKFDGTEKTRYSESPGKHSFIVSPNGKYFFDRWSNTQNPHRVELRTTQNGGSLIKTIVSNEAVKSYLNQYAYQPRELFNFTTDYGVDLDGYLIRPRNFDPNETYPLVLMVYGGPGSQGVFNEFETSTWVQYLAQQGYVIANINNRGSSGYGRNFKKSVHKKLGILESEDYAATANYLGNYSWIDKNRIAIYGHSYGGFMSSISAVLHPNTFKVSLTGAPVTDWRLYNSIYSERHMGLPDENEEGYNNSSVMHHAARLKAKMLVAHSTMDRDVHIQNTMQMITAFTEAGKDVDLRIFPKGDHAVAYNEQSYLLLYKVYTDYLEKHLK